jgi:hypothetical protein
MGNLHYKTATYATCITLCTATDVMSVCIFISSHINNAQII